MLLRKKTQHKTISALEILKKSGPLNMNENQRAHMTVSCQDTASIPKVKQAGLVIVEGGKKVQVMHNGLKVSAGGYYGDWMVDIIKKLKGHHEPQEEKVFYHLLNRINKSKPVMVELGSFWAYYSLWFKYKNPKGKVICCEPDPHNIKIGRKNMLINNFTEGEGLVFYNSAAGRNDGQKVTLDMDSKPGEKIDAFIRSVDSISIEQKLEYIDILHMDVQGVELDALEGAVEVIKEKKVRFLVVSTHHYVFSGDPMTHHKCLRFIQEHGGTIITAHNIIESYSGDGLIVASFDKEDKDFNVDISINTGEALFRPYELDIAVIMQEYDKHFENSKQA